MIMRDVDNGYILRYTHANVASFFFIFVYAHIGRGLWYGSYRAPRVLLWSIGVIILVLMMAIGFLGYVLPFGQMSLWGATVITNLLSAIPVFGQDIVELIWGGFTHNLTEEPYNRDIVLKILLIAGTFSRSPLSKECGGRDIKYSYIRSIIVKKLITIKKPAGIRNKSYLEVPQRLNAGDLTFAYLVGLIEGDGWFSISKKGKYLMYEFGIEVALRDVQLIYKIKNLLGVGTVCFRNKESRNNTVLFRVRNKSHLINVILPIFDKYPFFSNKQYNYLRFREALLNDIKYYEELDTNYIWPNISLNSINFIINAPYFSAWLVGFIEAGGCFSIYKPTKDSSLVASFDISQTEGENLILAIREYLSLSSNIYKAQHQTNSFKIKVSSVRSVENVIKFMQKAPVKLMGNKKLQYLLWLKELRQITRYTKKIIIPDIY